MSAAEPTQERFWTADELAELLRVTGACVRAWVRQGRLRGYRFGDRIRIPDSAVMELLDASEVSKASSSRNTST
jgi:excisionase family DNA binding protein